MKLNWLNPFHCWTKVPSIDGQQSELREVSELPIDTGTYFSYRWVPFSLKTNPGSTPDPQVSVYRDQSFGEAMFYLTPFLLLLIMASFELYTWLVFNDPAFWNSPSRGTLYWRFAPFSLLMGSMAFYMRSRTRTLTIDAAQGRVTFECKKLWRTISRLEMPEPETKLVMHMVSARFGGAPVKYWGIAVEADGTAMFLAINKDREATMKAREQWPDPLRSKEIVEGPELKGHLWRRKL